MTPLPWGAEALWLELRTLLPGLSVEVVERCSSTNTSLLERARVVMRPEADSADVLVQRSVESAAFGRRAADVQPCLLVAEHQTGGRGRLGRGWQSTPGASLTFSLSMPIERTDWSGLSLVVGLALAEALDPAREGAVPRVVLKWPNDLWLLDAPHAGRKLGGVLIETVAASAKRLAVIGVGLNVRPMQTTEVGTGFACLQEIDPLLEAPAALHRVALPLVQTVRRFEREGFTGFMAGYARRDLLLGQPVRTTQQGLTEGIAEGVDERGALQVRTPAGRVAVTSGEVSVRLGVDGSAG